MAGQRIGQIVNHPQMSGKAIFYLGGSNFNIEGLAQNVDLKVFVEKMVGNGYVQFDNPAFLDKVNSVYAQQYGGALTAAPTPMAPAPVPLPTAAPAPATFPPLPTGNIPTPEAFGLPSASAPIPMDVGGGFPALPTNVPANSNRTVGWGFMKFAVTDNGGNIPEEVKGFHIGSLMWNWIWGLFHGQSKLALIYLFTAWVPVWGLAVWIYWGMFGNELAWAANPGKWSSVEEYQQSQKIWKILGYVSLGIFVLSMIGMVISMLTAGAQFATLFSQMK